MSAVGYKFSAVFNNSVEFVELGKSLCCVFWRMQKYNMRISDSSLPVGVLNSVVSQLDGFCDDLCGPFHNDVDVEVLKAHFLLK
jgi:hypothetical protein